MIPDPVTLANVHQLAKQTVESKGAKHPLILRIPNHDRNKLGSNGPLGWFEGASGPDHSLVRFNAGEVFYYTKQLLERNAA